MEALVHWMHRLFHRQFHLAMCSHDKCAGGER